MGRYVSASNEARGGYRTLALGGEAGMPAPQVRDAGGRRNRGGRWRGCTHCRPCPLAGRPARHRPRRGRGCENGPAFACAVLGAASHAAKGTHDWIGEGMANSLGVTSQVATPPERPAFTDLMVDVRWSNGASCIASEENPGVIVTISRVAFNDSVNLPALLPSKVEFSS